MVGHSREINGFGRSPPAAKALCRRWGKLFCDGQVRRVFSGSLYSLTACCWGGFPGRAKQKTIKRKVKVAFFLTAQEPVLPSCLCEGIHLIISVRTFFPPFYFFFVLCYVCPVHSSSYPLAKNGSLVTFDIPYLLLTSLALFIRSTNSRFGNFCTRLLIFFLCANSLTR